MSVRTKMLGFVDVILRVPPIFIIDEILKISMGLPFTTQNDSSILDNSQIPIIETTTSQVGTSAGASTDNILFNGTVSSNNFSSSNSSLDHFLNTSSAELFGDAIASVADETEFYKLISLTSLKFLSCLLGENDKKKNNTKRSILFELASISRHNRDNKSL